MHPNLNQSIPTSTSSYQTHCPSPLSQSVIPSLTTSSQSLVSPFNSNYNCLKRHQIPLEVRARLIDWLIEVHTKLNYGGNTFFLSLQIMEKYLANTTRVIKSDDMHLIGSISLFIASKYQEMNSMSVGFMAKNIVRGKYTEKEIIVMEYEVLKVIGFDVFITVGVDLLGYLCQVVNPPFVICRIAEIILILNTFEYNNYYPPCEEATAALFIAARSLNQMDLAARVVKASELTEDELTMTIISIQNTIDSYKLRPPKFKSLGRYLGFRFESIETRKLLRFYDCALENSQLTLMTVF